MDVLPTLLATGPAATGVTPAGASSNADMLLAGTSATVSPAVPTSAGLFSQVLSLLQQGTEASNQSAKLTALAGTVALINKDDKPADALKDDLSVTALDLVMNPAMAGMMAQLPVVPVLPVSPVGDVSDNIVVGEGTAKKLITADQIISTLKDAQALVETKMAADPEILPVANVAKAVTPFAIAQASALVPMAAVQQDNNPLPIASIEGMVQNAIKEAVKQVVPQNNQAVTTPPVAPQSVAPQLSAAQGNTATTTELPVTGANSNNAPASATTEKLKDVLVKTDITVPSAQNNAVVVTDVIAAKSTEPVQQDVVANLAKNPAITFTQESVKTSENKETVTAKSDVKTTPGNDLGNKVAETDESSGKETTEEQDSSFLSDNSQKQPLLQKTDGVKKHEFAQYQAAVLTPPPAEQIKISVTKALKEGDGNISIQLKPMDLGRVDVRVEFTADGKATIHIAAEKQDTLSLLQKDSQSLEKSLSEAGLKAESGSLNFSLRDGSPQQGRRESQQQPFAHAYPTQAGEENTESKIAGMKQYTGYISMNNGLDIRV